MAIYTNENGQETWDGQGPNPFANTTGANTDPAAAIWRGAQRTTEWMPPNFSQTYGNYTGLYPSLGQQVGQALWGSIQAQNYQPSWTQTMLPSRQNNTRDMSKYSPFQSGGRTMANPYPLNGRLNLGDTRNIGNVSNAGNPFIGTYAGLGGSPGGGLTGGNGLTPTSWGEPAPGSGGTTTGGPSSGGTPFTGIPPGPATGGTQPPNPFIEPAPGSGGTTTGGPSMGGQPYQPPTQGFAEPAPGSGGMSGGPGMYGSPYGGGTTTGPGGPINPNPSVGTANPFQQLLRMGGNKGLQISPQVISGLLGMFGGGR